MRHSGFIGDRQMNLYSGSLRTATFACGRWWCSLNFPRSRSAYSRSERSRNASHPSTSALRSGRTVFQTGPLPCGSQVW